MRVVIYREDDGTVVNAAVHDPQSDWTPGPGLAFEAAPDHVGVGWRRTGPSVFEPIAVSSESRRAAAVQQIDQAFAGRFAAGFNYGGHNYQIDGVSQGNITTYGTRASAVLAGVSGATWPAQFSWIRTDNGREPFTAAAFYVFSQAAQDYVTALYYVRRALKDAVAVADDPEAVVAAATWPSN